MEIINKYILEKLKLSHTKTYQENIESTLENIIPFKIETQNHQITIDKYIKIKSSLYKSSDKSYIYKFYSKNQFIFSCRVENLIKILDNEIVMVWGRLIKQNETGSINIKIIS